MKKQNEKIEQKITSDESEEWKNKYLRALADYQNLEKRSVASRLEDRIHASAKIIRELLPVLDILEKARDHLNDQGLGLAVKEFWKILDEQGVVKIDTKNREFDPFEMECVEVVDGNDNIVIEEVIAGYKLHDKVLRVAKVKVGKKPASQEKN